MWRKGLLILAMTTVLAGCNANGINPYGYATRYEVQERTGINQTFTHIGKLYYRGNLLVNDVGYVSIAPQDSRAIFSKENRLYYCDKTGAITVIDLLRYSTPVEVVWKKYRAEILFADQNPYELELF
ncbi:hypothetical protein FACS1894139_01540 [Planctomycetales bacterium]|nr:hypothetical protein FACS1894107_16860 [Planctomycetales bacterium]GHT02760.1 hypothetical protein FACS1894139_01540 [Planctomycetales bacterium]GHV21527.1 hypothetical protein AGMMS49959_10820 [Planctomycetales bacterium]